MLARSARNVLAKLPFKSRASIPATTISQHRGPRLYASLATLPASKDDLALVDLFDQPSTPLRSSPLSPTGLFGHDSVTEPLALVRLARATLTRAQLLMERILRARQSREELKKVVKNMDRLSDMLCGVIDLAELVRNAHPDPAWVNAANWAYEALCEFMNVANTHVGLYEVLRSVFSDPTIVKSLGPEAHQTALIFWRDFEKSAINLPPEQRQRFVSLSSEILVLGRQFQNHVMASRPPTEIKPSDLDGLKDKGLGKRLILQTRATKRPLLIYPGSLQAQMIMQCAPLEEPRRSVYMAANSSTPEQIDVLEKLLRVRGELARLAGRESYAEMVLDDKMAKSPANVRHFLDALLAHTAPLARKALRTLAERKKAHTQSATLPIIQAWDRDFYCPPDPPSPPIPLPPLTTGTVFMGLSRLFRHLYGISLRPAPVASGEVWDNYVHKMEVFHEDEGLIGWIYADLHPRSGKTSGAAHYTVRCSRRTDDDDDASDLAVEGDVEDCVRQSQAFEAAKRHRIRGQEGIYQLPLVVLLCEFGGTRHKNGPTILEWHEVSTLFHEMGHAMHSMIGRTEYQNVSGTRCATDFVELPSILMEHFLNSPAVLSLFDVKATSTIDQVGNHHEDPCHYIDTHMQILLSTVDQIYHSPSALEAQFDSTAVLAELHNTRGLIPYVPGTSSQTQFGHLFGYGATYYSYLFDRAIASRVWRNVFSSNPLNRETGEKFRREVLRYGGGKDPWAMVSALLDSPDLEVGDAEAMREVGKWRIEDEVAIPSRH